MRSLSLVLPAHDEVDSIELAVAQCLEAGQRWAVACEVVVVDDGSQDGTAERVRRIAAADPRVRLLQHGCNCGYGGAVRTGLYAARMERVFFTDADLQFDPDEVGLLLGVADRYDVVVGYRAPRLDPWPRRLAGRAWSQLVDRLFGTGVRDVDCAFKVLDRRVLDHIDLRSSGAFINAELLVRVRAAGFSVAELPVSHRRRVAGSQSGARPKVVARALWEVAELSAELRALRTHSRSAARPAAEDRPGPAREPVSPTG